MHQTAQRIHPRQSLGLTLGFTAYALVLLTLAVIVYLAFCLIHLGGLRHPTHSVSYPQRHRR
jgi:hypothetical protein